MEGGRDKSPAVTTSSKHPYHSELDTYFPDLSVDNFVGAAPCRLYSFSLPISLETGGMTTMMLGIDEIFAVIAADVIPFSLCRSYSHL